MRVGRWIIAAAGLACWVAGVAWPGAALAATMDRTVPSQQQSQQGSAPTIQVYSRETLVDVTVTDKDGKPVHGLTRADFSITEDTKPQPMRSFEEFDSATQAASSAPRKLPANTYTNLQTGNGPLYVLLFDGINGRDGNDVRTRRAAATFIRNMAPGTRVALLALGDRLTVLQGPSTDPALLLERVSAPSKDLSVRAIACVKQVALDWATLDQLNQVATYLSGVKGKKNLIWIGDGTPDLIWGDCQDWKLPLQNTYNLLEDAQVTVYPVDAGGVHALGGGQLAMEAVAEATGGVAYYERNDLETLMANAVHDGASYYTLSYVPPGSAEYDGRYHAISVKVDRPGVHLLYRKGYSAEDPTLIEHPPEKLFGIVTRDTRPTGPAADPLVAAMSPVAPPATQLLFDVRVEPSTEEPGPFDAPVMGQLNARFKKAPLTRYSFLYALPVNQIGFSDSAGVAYSGSLEFNVAAFDGDGSLVTLRSQTMKLPLTGDEYREFVKTPFQFLQQVDLPPGKMTLRVGVLDGVGKKLGTMEIPVTVKGAEVVKAGR